MTKADWLRSEIDKLEGMKKVPNPNKVIPPTVMHGIVGYNQALTSIITRYKEELEVLESK